ncbi:MAG: zinc ribbon domain-containing protein [Deltaproteobacteria bacterium]|nr:MAG: zinc ribbon domain-containing protein [Deltaproteobacteria bacterium]
MPIYEYQCSVCGQVIEEWQKFSDPPLTTCPSCGGSLTKLISHSAFHLKGSGWYVTDYHRSNPGSAKSSETPAEKSPPATAEKLAATKSDDQTV